MQKEYLSAAAEVLSDQGVDENLGLSTGEASSRFAKTGPNKLEEAEKTPLWKRFFASRLQSNYRKEKRKN